MSYIERTLNAAQNPVDEEVALEWRKNKEELTRKFFRGEIDGKTYLERQKNYNIPPWVVTIPYPGPLYGLLRRVGVDKKTSSDIAYHERDHYAVSQANHVFGAVHLEFIRKKGDKSSINSNEFAMRVFISFELPDDIDEEKLKSIIKEVLLAPEHPGPEDLAKIKLD